MLSIGITGGIGSGKSTVCAIFKTWGIPVFDADDVAKKVYQLYPDVLAELQKLFGEDIAVEKELNKKKFASIVFNDATALQKVNTLIHPKVKLMYHAWLEQQHSPYIIREAAILIESGAYRDCDRIVLISAPVELRIERTMQRSNFTRNEVLQRMAAQWTDEQKEPYAQHVIRNDDRNLVLPQVLDLHHQFITASGTEV
ncbi:MAG: dephospho-CoA kinase [Flavobacteriales bacterium]